MQENNQFHSGSARESPTRPVAVSSFQQRQGNSSFHRIIGESIENYFISLRQASVNMNRILFSKEFPQYCLLIIALFLPLVVYNTPDFVNIKVENLGEALSYRGLLVPLFIIGICLVWGFLNFFHSFIFGIEYIQYKNKNQMNYFNSIVFQPLFYLFIMKASIFSKLTENRIDRISWVFISVIFDFVYSYTDYIFNFSVERCSKVVLIEDLLKARNKVLGESIFLMGFSIIYTYFLFNFFISIYDFNFIFFYTALSKGVYLFFNQLELLYSILDSFNQIIGTYITDEKSYLRYLRAKCYCSLVNYFMFAVYVAFFWNAVQDLNNYATTFFIIYLMLLHYKSIKRVIDIFFAYTKARNFFAELNQM